MTVKIQGGDLAAKRLKELRQRLGGNPEVNIGFLAGATYPDGTPVAQVAAWQEYGTRTAPARSFFRTMIAEKKASWGPAVAKLLVQNDYDLPRTLGLMGAGIKGQLQDSIIKLVLPALSPVTLMLRKMRAADPNLVVTGATVREAVARVEAGESTGGVNTKPLVDSAHMLNSVDYEVKQ